MLFRLEIMGVSFLQNVRETEIPVWIEKSREGTYFEVPFEVPDDVERLEISYDYRRRDFRQEGGSEYDPEINIVDLAVRDETGGFRGASGSERKEIYFTENEATPGYLCGKIGKGTWALVLGAYRIAREGCSVKVRIRAAFRHRVLLKGDLHLHTWNSDGKYSVEDVEKAARLHGMDFIFLTDHNTFSQNDQIHSSDALVVLPGMEWTHYRGHANFLGVKRPVERIFANDKKTVSSIFREAEKRGAMVILNHPFCRFCPWKWGFDVPFDGVEIWNGPMKESEYDAIRWWDEQLKKGRKLPAVGGSDAHRSELFRMIGTPTDFVYSDSRGASDIMKAIRGGSLFISYIPEGPTIDLKAGGASMGGTAPSPDVRSGVLKIGRIRPGDTVRLISNRGVEKELTIRNQSAETMDFRAEGRKYFRAEVWRTLFPGVTALASISNPVYLI